MMRDGCTDLSLANVPAITSHGRRVCSLQETDAAPIPSTQARGDRRHATTMQTGPARDVSCRCRVRYRPSAAPLLGDEDDCKTGRDRPKADRGQAPVGLTLITLRTTCAYPKGRHRRRPGTDLMLRSRQRSKQERNILAAKTLDPVTVRCDHAQRRRSLIRGCRLLLGHRTKTAWRAGLQPPPQRGIRQTQSFGRQPNAYASRLLRNDVRGNAPLKILWITAALGIVLRTDFGNRAAQLRFCFVLHGVPP